jgi:hypothetical protein
MTWPVNPLGGKTATNADLREQVTAGRFRADLFFRLNTVEIPLPPLRDRENDIRLLAMYFLAEHSRRYRKNLTGFSDSAIDLPFQYRCPAKVRELDHAVERAVLMAQGSHIQPADLSLQRQRASERLEDLSLEEVERLLVQKALGRFHRNVSQAAQSLGLSRSPLYRRMERYGLGERSNSSQGVRLRMAAGPGSFGQRVSFETRIVLLVLLVGVPGSSAALVLLWHDKHSIFLGAIVTVAIVGLWVALSLALRKHVVFPLQTLSNILAAIRERDYSVRARGSEAHDALGELFRETNTLAETLRGQRLGALEATTPQNHGGGRRGGPGLRCR